MSANTPAAKAEPSGQSAGKRVTVVGAGLAGLTAAVVAARLGATVRVLEARTSIGGRARTDLTDGGFHLNHGAHALYVSTPGIAILHELGIKPRGSEPDATHGFGTLRDRLDRLPATPASALRTRLIPFAAKAQLGTALARPKALLNRPSAGRSMRDWVDTLVSHPDARALTDVLVRTATYDVALEHLDATAAVAQIVAAFVDNVLYLDGGWQQLVDALRDQALSSGVVFETNAKVSDLGSVGDADAVVLAPGGPQHVASILGGRSATFDRYRLAAQPVRAAALDLALRRLPVPERRVVLGVDEPLYFSAHTPAGKLAPATGGEVVHVLLYGGDALVPDGLGVPTAPGSSTASMSVPGVSTSSDQVATSPNQSVDGYDGRSDAVRVRMEAFLDRCQPGWRDQVIEQRYRRQLVVTHDRPQTGRGLAGRATVHVPECDHVFVAGDWVGSTGMLADAALASGREAALAAMSR